MEKVTAEGFRDGICLVCRGHEIEDYCEVGDRVRRRPGETWRIRRCRRCGFGWTEPMPAPEDIGALYPPGYLGDTESMLDDFLAGRLQRTRSWRGEMEKARLLERFVPAGRILDVGCGDARFLLALDPARYERTGIDPAASALETVRSRMPDLVLIAGDLHAAPLAEGTFDALTFWHALEHMPDTRRVLRRAAALLKGGGMLIVSLPNLQSLQARIFRADWYAFDDVPRHLYHFSRRSLELLLAEAGFDVRRCLAFSRRVDFHCLKHSLLNRCGPRPGGRVLYYTLKPALFALALIERLSGRPGIITIVARRS